MKRKYGFTLIELLVVILVLSILVILSSGSLSNLIARAKVARVRGDLKALGDVLGVYYLDWGRYPYQGAVTPRWKPVKVVIPVGLNGVVASNDYGPGGKMGSPQGRYSKFVPWVITTPIEYIGELPRDIFYSGDAGGLVECSYYYYNNYMDSIEWMLGDGGMGREDIETMLVKSRIWGAWSISSGGPDGDRWDLMGDKVGFNLTGGIYSPTNGVRSNGDMVIGKKYCF